MRLLLSRTAGFRDLLVPFVTAVLIFGCSSDSTSSDGTTGESTVDASGTTGADGATGASGSDGTGATTGTDGTTSVDGTTGATATTDITYATHIEPLLNTMCVRCHSPGGIREGTPFTSYDEVQPLAMLIKDKVSKRIMPPWMADGDCKEYAYDESLSEEEIAWIAEWADAEAPQGDVEAEPVEIEPRVFSTLSREDLEITMKAPYVPGLSPDDYRCFVLDWPLDEDKFITGFGAKPGNPRVVHHVISYLADPDVADMVDGWDAAEEGPGYTCYGGPTPAGTGSAAASNLRFVGGWAPGGVGSDFAPGTGMPVKPGSRIVMQVHYNTISNAPEPDQTSFVVKLDDSVEREGFVLPWTNFQWLSGQGMKIPAGESEVTHSFASTPDTFVGFFNEDAKGKEFTLHSATLHMHTLGVSGSVHIERADGSTECLLEIPRYDFGWQRSYGFKEPVVLKPGDKIGISCTWDNSPANQLVIDGTPLAPVDQQWGEGTTDEMCIAFFYVVAR